MILNLTKIQDYLNNCDTEEELSQSETKIIKDLVERDNYVQLINSFSINKALCVLNYLESKEEYKKCQKLYKQIKILNRVEGRDYKTHL